MTNLKGLCGSKKIYGCVTECTKKLLWLPPLLGRLSMAAVFIPSGWGKLHSLDKVTAFFVELGIPAAHLQAPFVAGVEFVGGILLLLGIATRFATVPLIIAMIVAILTAKLSDIHSVSDFLAVDEYLYIVIMIGIFIWGAGCVSLDALIAKKCCAKDASQNQN